VLKWGDTRRPYFAHLSKSECKGGGEAFVHKKAKDYLCEALNQGEEITFQYSCPVAPHTHTIQLKLNDGEVAKTEVKVSNGFADIGVLNKDGEVRFIVEICNTHRTQARDGEWVEVNAEEVMQYVVKQQAAYLTCIRKRAPCITAPCWKMVLKNFHCKGRNFGFSGDPFIEATLWVAFCQLGRCIDCFNRHPVAKGRPFCPTCYRARFSSKPLSPPRDFFRRRVGCTHRTTVSNFIWRQNTKQKVFDDILDAIYDDDVCAVQQLVERHNITGDDIRDECTFHWAAKYDAWQIFDWLTHRVPSSLTTDDMKNVIQAPWNIRRFPEVDGTNVEEKRTTETKSGNWNSCSTGNIDQPHTFITTRQLNDTQQITPLISHMKHPALKQRRIDDYIIKK